MAGVPYVFGNATTSIPLSNLDADFNTPVTIGTSTVGLGNTTTSLVGLSNVSTTIVGSTGNLTIQSGSTTAVTIDTSQNVGIGTSSPAGYKLNVNGTSNFSGAINLTAASSVQWNGGDAAIVNSGTNLLFKTYNGSSLAEQARIDSSGNLLVGTTTAYAPLSVRSANGGNGISTRNDSGTGAYNAVVFTNNGQSSVVGTIYVAGSTVTYNTSSDYRLKNDVAPIQNALATVESLNPVSFTWVDGRPDDGFLAHEIQAIIPNCVIGEKDAVNEDGTPKYQQMDNSGVIPFLVKAIQEQQALITDLTARLTALEAK